MELLCTPVISVCVLYDGHKTQSGPFYGRLRLVLASNQTCFILPQLSLSRTLPCSVAKPLLTPNWRALCQHNNMELQNNNNKHQGGGRERTK